MKMYFCRVICLLLLFFHTAVIAQECTEENLEKCVAPMKRFNLTENTAIFPDHTIQEMREICRVYDEEVEDCLRPVISKCPKNTELRFVGINLTYYFICDLTLDDYEKYQPCLANKKLHTSGKLCLDNLESNLDKLNNTISDHTKDSYLKEVCNYANHYLDCVENTVKSFCGAATASWQRTVDTLSLAPLLDSIDCDYIQETINTVVTRSSKEQDIVLIVVIVILCIMAVLMLVIAILVFIRRKRKRQALEHEYNMQMQAGNVPPYEMYPGSAAGGPQSGVNVVMVPPSYTEKGQMPPAYASGVGSQGVYDNAGLPYKAGMSGVGRAPTEVSSIAPSMSASQAGARHPRLAGQTNHSYQST